jgi:orotate phosphoribosyltransferase
MELTELQQKYVSAVYQTKSLLIREEPFQLKSGGKSHIYLNHNNFLVQSRYLKLIAEIYLKSLPIDLTDFSLGVVDSLMSPLIVGAISATSSRNLVMINTKRSKHGAADEVFGSCAGEIVLIDDMTSTGSTIIETAAAVRRHGASVTSALVSAARDQKAKENLASVGITLISLFTFEQIITLLKEQLTTHELALVEKELHTKELL